ncbi:MAG: response regulator [Bacteroidia bacterium]|nr:response regulator [Bacteroidia bacterium]
MNTRILLVEDNVFHLQKIIAHLKSAPENYEIFTAQAGEKAIQIAETILPDLIIMDWDLRGARLSGLDATKLLVKSEKTKHIPIIMATAYTSSERLDRAMKAGTVDYLRKPIERTEFLARIRSALVLRKLSQEDINLLLSHRVSLKKKKIRILFLASDSMNLKEKADLELREIKGELTGRSKNREMFKFEQRSAVRIKDFYRAIIDERPEILHFSGVANEEGLILEGKNGEEQIAFSEGLVKLFSLIQSESQKNDNKPLMCAFINANHSSNLAEQLSTYVQYVIGIEGEVPEDEAILFATAFYDAIGAGKQVPFAFQLGKSNLALNNKNHSDSFQIFTQS